MLRSSRCAECREIEERRIPIPARPETTSPPRCKYRQHVINLIFATTISVVQTALLRTNEELEKRDTCKIISLEVWPCYLLPIWAIAIGRAGQREIEKGSYHRYYRPARYQRYEPVLSSMLVSRRCTEDHITASIGLLDIPYARKLYRKLKSAGDV